MLQHASKKRKIEEAVKVPVAAELTAGDQAKLIAETPKYFSSTSWYNGFVTIQMIEKLPERGYIAETLEQAHLNPEDPLAFIHVRASHIDDHYFYFDCPFCSNRQRKACVSLRTTSVEHAHGSENNYQFRPELRVPHCCYRTAAWPSNAGSFVIWITPKTTKDY